jgi:hypothetical protein
MLLAHKAQGKIKITSGYLKLLSDGSGLGCSVVVFSVFIIAVAFKLYDLHQTGYIEREEVFMIHRCTLGSTRNFVFFFCSFFMPMQEKKIKVVVQLGDVRTCGLASDLSLYTCLLLNLESVCLLCTLAICHHFLISNLISITQLQNLGPSTL